MRVSALLAFVLVACEAPIELDAGDAPIVDAGCADCDGGVPLDDEPKDPILALGAMACDFGEVPRNTVARCEVVIENKGDRDLAITELGFSDDTVVAVNSLGLFDTSTPGFGIETIVFLPHFIPPGSGSTLRLFVRPPRVGSSTGALIIGSNDNTQSLALSVVGLSFIEANVRIALVNGEQPTSDHVVRPGDEVRLSSDGSKTTMPRAIIVSREWWLIEQPVNAHVEIASLGDGVLAFLQIDNFLPTGPAVSGTYRVGLRVTDSSGASDETEFELVVANPGLSVELIWDLPGYDFDLHFLRTPGPWCSQSSCFYANCNVNSAFVTLPEWDGAPGETGGDPWLTSDDLSGYGPEVIAIEEPGDAVYRVGVHAYSFTIAEPVVVIIAVRAGGFLLQEYMTEFTEGHSFWISSEILVEDGSIVTYPINEVYAGWSCGF